LAKGNGFVKAVDDSFRGVTQILLYLLKNNTEADAKIVMERWIKML